MLSRVAIMVLTILPMVGLSQTKTLPGAAIDSATRQPVRMASILVVNTGKTVISRNNGQFEVTVSAGQVIAYSANGYYADTMTIRQKQLEEGSLLLVLRPLPSTLQSVTVTASNLSPYQLDSLERRRSFLEDVGENALPVVSRANDLGFGVGINLDRWSRRQKQGRKARSLFDLLEEDAYINYRWNEETVRKYTTFADEELYQFMQQYRPSHDWLRRHPSEEDLLYYINDSLKKYRRTRRA